MWIVSLFVKRELRVQAQPAREVWQRALPAAARIFQAKMSFTPFFVSELQTCSGRLASDTMQSIQPKGA